MSAHSRPPLDPCDFEFTLTATVKVIRQSFLATKANGDQVQQEDTSVILIPEEGSQRESFLSAWCPDFDMRDENPHLENKDKASEIIMQIGYPVGGYSRGAVIRGSQYHPEPHIFVQTKGVENDLIRSEGQRIMLTVQDARKEYDLSVLQKDYDLPFQKVGFKNEGAADHVNIMPGV